MKTMKKALILLILCIALISMVSCADVSTTISMGAEVQGAAVDTCRSFCMQEKEKGTNLSNGPCISDMIIKDWVCDIAHSPRQGIDNNPENQCSSFREGSAHHYVELDQECNLIRYY